MKLKLTKPIIFFDLETTGIDVSRDRIVEISYHKVFPNGKEETKTYLINPEMPIPPSSTAIHGISDADVADCPTFKQVANEIERDFEKCDIAGYNSNRFDVPLLAEEFMRAECDIDLKKSKLVDVQVVFHKMEQRTLSAAYKFYCDKDLTDAHSASADALATYEVLLSQLDRYNELENNVDFLSKYTTQTNNVDFSGRMIYNEKGEEVFNFGKHKGKRVIDVFQTDVNYYNWMMENDFPLYTKKVLTSLKLSMFNK